MNHDINPGRGSDKRRGIVSDSVFNGGWRSLRAAHSGKVLDVTGGSTSAGTYLEQWTLAWQSKGMTLRDKVWSLDSDAS